MRLVLRLEMKLRLFLRTVIGITCLQAVAETNAPPEVTVETIIRGLRANEAKISSVLIEGSYQRTAFSSDGDVVSSRSYALYRFLRSNDLIRVERQGVDEVPGPDQKLQPLNLNQVLFYSPDAVVDVNLRNRAANKRWPEPPFPFPLSYGFGMHYHIIYATNYPKASEMRTTSTALENNLKGGFLVRRNDPKNPNLVLLEAAGPTARVTWHIDLAKGYLILRREFYEILAGPPVREVLLEKLEVVPKEFDGYWYVSEARREYCMVVNNDPTLKDYCPQWEVETFTVSKFRPGVVFKPNELEFSTNEFRNLRFLADSIKKEGLDLETGERGPWPSSSQQPPK